MNALPEGMQGKVLAVAMAVLAAATVYFAFISPLFAFYDANAQMLQDRQDAFRRYQNAAQDLPRLRSAAKQWGDPSAPGELLLPGESDAIAAANLQSTLKDMVEEGGAKLTTAQALPAEVVPGFRRIGVRAAFSGNMTLLTSVLLSLESAHPVLSVNNLEVRGGESEEALSIAMDVYGLRPE